MGCGHIQRNEEAARRVVAAEMMGTEDNCRSPDEPPSRVPPRETAMACACCGQNATPTRTAAAAVEVIDAESRLRSDDLHWLADAGTRASMMLDARGEVRVRLVGDTEMADAHERYSGIPGTTDVLTFDLRDESQLGSTSLDVDVLICVDEAQRQAESHGVSLRHEILLYIVHAMLHCLGHDDHDEADAARMHAREDEVLTTIGVGPVYSRTNTSREGAA